MAIVGHGHMLRVLGARWIEPSAAEGDQLAFSTGAVCEPGFECVRRGFRTWNDTRHLG